MDRSVTEELAELLQKKKTDFILLSKLPDDFLKRFGLKGSNGAQITKILSPYLGDVFRIKNVGNSKYLIFKQPDEVLLFRIVKKSAGKKPRVKSLPFQKSEYLTILNRLIQEGKIRVKISNDYEPLLSSADDVFSSPAQENTNISAETFKEAYFELERGKFFARICDLRRHLGWTAREFDKVLTGLRDTGKIQLQGGDIDYFTKEDIGASFIDENGTLKLTVMWRQ